MKTCKEMAAIWNVTERIVSIFCKKIAGAVKNGKNWYEAVDAVAYQTETAWLGIAFPGKKVVARMA